MDPLPRSSGSALKRASDASGKRAVQSRVRGMSAEVKAYGKRCGGRAASHWCDFKQPAVADLRIGARAGAAVCASSESSAGGCRAREPSFY